MDLLKGWKQLELDNVSRDSKTLLEMLLWEILECSEKADNTSVSKKIPECFRNTPEYFESLFRETFRDDVRYVLNFDQAEMNLW